jgi:hypothetical protein
MRKFLPLICILVFCAIILLPPIIHGYVYPSLGDDTAEPHLTTFDAILNSVQTGQAPPEFRYMAYAVVGYPMAYISMWTGASPNDLFLWFNFLAMVAVGVSCYFVVSRLVNRVAGMFALFLPVFCAQGLMFLFYCGTIFNIVNIGIILPWLVYFAVRWFRDKRIYQLVSALVLAVLFCTFHASGVYLPAVVALGVVAFAAYSLWRRRWTSAAKITLLGAGVAAFCLACVWFITPDTMRAVLATFVSGRIWGGISGGAPMAVPPVLFLTHIVSVSVLAVLAFSAVVVYKSRGGKIRAETKMLVYALCCLMLPLIPTAFINQLALDVCRQAMALATLVALLASVLVGLVWEFGKSRLWVLGLVALALAGALPNAIDWCGYNSAVRQVDKEAIAYANTLDARTFSCDTGVAYWIYDRFTKEEYVEIGGDILITRNLPQTGQCNPDDYWFRPHGAEPDANYVLLASFGPDKDGTIIDIYMENNLIGHITTIRYKR